jgi:phosphatidylinositol glycan class W
MNSEYKASKEAFVSGMIGSTVLHVNMISGVALVCISGLSITSKLTII